VNSGSEKSLKLNQNYLFLCLVLLQVPYSSSLYDYTSACFSFREGTAKTGTENPRRNKEFLIPLAVLCLCLLNPYVNHASMLIMVVASISLSQSHYSTKMYAASFTSLLCPAQAACLMKANIYRVISKVEHQGVGLANLCRGEVSCHVKQDLFINLHYPLPRKKRKKRRFRCNVWDFVLK